MEPEQNSNTSTINSPKSVQIWIRSRFQKARERERKIEREKGKGREREKQISRAPPSLAVSPPPRVDVDDELYTFARAHARSLAATISFAAGHHRRRWPGSCNAIVALLLLLLQLLVLYSSKKGGRKWLFSFLFCLFVWMLTSGEKLESSCVREKASISPGVFGSLNLWRWCVSWCVRLRQRGFACSSGACAWLSSSWGSSCGDSFFVFFLFFFLCFWGGEVGRFGFLVVRSICQKAGFLYIAKKNVFFNFICGSLAKWY